MTLQSPDSDRRPRVLIVEDDPILALATLNECLKVGLEPKLCVGPEASSSCPALRGEECPRTHAVEATLLTINNGAQRIAAPECVGGRVVLTGERPFIGAPTMDVIDPDAVIEYPYDPKRTAELLFSMVMDERRRQTWDLIREATGKTTPPDRLSPPSLRSPC